MEFGNMAFSKDHEWVRREDESGSDVVIGITEYAAGELGDIIFVELPEVGAKIEASQAIGTIEAVKTVADLYAPVSGIVTETNGALEDRPEVINDSPYDDGWFIKVKMDDPSEFDSLMDYDAYREMIGEA